MLKVGFHIIRNYRVTGCRKKTTPFENLQLKLTEKQSDPHFLTIISLCYEGKKNTKFVCKSWVFSRLWALPPDQAFFEMNNENGFHGKRHLRGMQQIIFEYDKYYSLKISLTVQSDSKTVGEGVKQKSDVIIKKTLQCYEANIDVT